MSSPSILCVWQFRADQFREGREQVNRHGRFPANAGFGIRPGQRAMKRDAQAAVPAGALALAQRQGGAGVVAVGKPRAVIRRENDQRVFFQVMFAQCRHDFADGPINLPDHIAVKAARGLSLEPVAYVERDVRHVVGHIEEERTVLVPPR